MANGVIDFPQINPKYDKNGDYCFMYLNKAFEATSLDQSYRADIVKFDVCNDQVAGMWGDDTFAAQEV